MDIYTTVLGMREPIQPTPMKNIWDAFQGGNDVLMSYLLEDATIDCQELANLLRDPGQLYEHLQDVCTNPEIRASLGLSRTLPSPDIDVSLGAMIRYYCPDLAALECENQIIVGEKQERKYTYPDGEEVDYFLIPEELTANMPISTAAFCLSTPRHGLFVRYNGLRFMAALAEAIRNIPQFNDYSAQFPGFDHDMLGIILGHEEAEAELLEQPGFDSLPGIEKELMVERSSGPRLIKRGIPKKSYELFHKLRSEGSQDPHLNVSHQVLAQNSHPLSL
jgi:hypothetical protein